MTIDQTLAEVLDETITALSSLDAVKLNVLERRIAVFTESNVDRDVESVRSVLPKQRQLEIILQNFQVNLDALTRLHDRNMRNQWEQ